MTRTETITITTKTTHISYDAVAFVIFGVFFILVGIGIDHFFLR